MADLDELKPLIGVFSFVVLATAGISFLRSDYTLMSLGRTFMAMFFLTFGGFKVYNLGGFKEAFKSYDPLAQRSDIYAIVYPFLEIGTGALYFSLLYMGSFQVELATHLIAVTLMSVNGFGVLKALSQGRELQCACLGNVFNVPMTKVTLAEDGLMSVMAVMMLVALFGF
jgi:hypothetical protein